MARAPKKKVEEPLEKTLWKSRQAAQDVLGRVCRPCCGSGGMFVQSEKFIEAHQGRIADTYHAWRRLGKAQRAQQPQSKYEDKDVMEYRRSHQPGGSYFFTLVTHQRQPLLTISENIHRLRTAFRREKEKYPFTIDAIVILPDHLHTLWSLPEEDADYSTRWSRIKRFFSICCVGTCAAQSTSRHSKREKPVWQRRFWEYSIRDENDWRTHMDYIHYNPVKHGHARKPDEWPYSSFTRCVQKVWYKPDWGTAEPENIKSIHYE